MDDISNQEFDELLGLVHEFSSIDRSCFPFSHLADSDIPKAYGFPPSNDGLRNYPCSKSAIRRDLRKECERQKLSYFPDLSVIFDLPLETTLEVFEHLHPIDLYSLIRSSKGLRIVLLSRKSFAVWQQAFDRHPDIPSCPSYISYPTWVSLLFGPSTCDICDRPDAMVDFTFLKRLCQPCSDGYSTCESDFQHFVENPEEREILWTLVKASHRTSSIMYPVHYEWVDPSYAKTEVDEMVKQMRAFLSSIEKNVLNAEEDYAKFKSAKAASVQKTMELFSPEHIKICSMWSLSIYQSIMKRLDESLPQLVAQWGKLLQSLGYHSEDIKSLGGYMEGIMYDLDEKRYAKKAFHRSLPLLERALTEHKADRLLQEQKALIVRRTKEAEAFYDSYKQTLDPLNWEYLPEFRRIMDLKPIFHYINFGEPAGVFPDEVAQQEVQTFVEKWLAVGRRHLSQLVSAHCLTVSKGDPLDLANAVFTCGVCYRLCNLKFPLFGWQDVALHLGCIIPSDPNRVLEEATFTSELSYSVAAYDVLKYLLGILELEPSKMQATEVVALEARFVCTVCPFSVRHGIKGRYPMTVKECVSHALDKQGHTPQSFMPLTDKATESVLFHENAYFWASKSSWSCTHCPKYFKDSASRQVVIAHVKETHLITRPAEMADFFCRRERCNKCTDTKNFRLWSENQVMPHLKDKHDVRNPIQGADWIQIDFYEHISTYSSLG
ncbi:hypothetical protein CPB84DRAFT_82393 [Gymnopilus junonius]|uniref:F-box domain-containing protein n=1 Tax=Gymnopilus junonius TaxID=109634 RepID=A0A9P5P2Q9_GYMJU|nr:hypothetical protein CPB84DRAFT_82393 [Gymnopilus junonius]